MDPRPIEAPKIHRAHPRMPEAVLAWAEDVAARAYASGRSNRATRTGRTTPPTAAAA